MLALQRGIGNRATARLLARIPANAVQHGWPLLYRNRSGSYEDDDGNIRWRRIALDDHEFYEDYVDYNIDHAMVAVELDTGAWSEMVVHYRDQRVKTFKRGDLPTTHFHSKARRGHGIGPIGAMHTDGFEKHDEDQFIYPTYQGKVVLTPDAVPNLTSLRDQAENTAEDLARLRGLAYLAGQFVNIMGMYGVVLGEIHGTQGGGHDEGRRRFTRYRNANEEEISLTGAKPREAPANRQTGPGGEPEQHTPMALDEGTGSTSQRQRISRPGTQFDPDAGGKGPARTRDYGGDEPESGKGGRTKKPPGKRSDSRAKGRVEVGTGKGRKGSTSRPVTSDAGSLEGERHYDVFRENGEKITDIDHIDGYNLVEEKSAVNASDVDDWVDKDITQKFFAYREARERLPPEYRHAKIVFRFQRIPEEAFWGKIMDEIEALQTQFPGELDWEILESTVVHE